jgi:hypothetical protein
VDMTFTLPGDARVEAHFGGFTLTTDQPPDATPFMLFLACCFWRRLARARRTTCRRSAGSEAFHWMALASFNAARLARRGLSSGLRFRHLERPPHITIETVTLTPA